MRRIIKLTTSRSKMNELLKRDCVAKKLGVGVRTVDTLVRERQIPFLKIRRSVRFCPTQIQDWLDKTKTDVS